MFLLKTSVALLFDAFFSVDDFVAIIILVQTMTKSHQMYVILKELALCSSITEKTFCATPIPTNIIRNYRIPIITTKSLISFTGRV